MTKFDGVHEALAEALAAKGYDSLTPVQEAVIDPALGQADLLVSAQTGSGKTVAFGLAMAAGLLGAERRLGLPGAPRALIIAPTRELAMQVRRELDWLYGSTGAVLASCVGGMDARSERRALERGAHIVVGTPGRICDHMRRGALDVSALEVAVLDEADEMLDLGFREDLEYILDAAPETRRTLMFSATVSKEIARLAGSYQRDAQRISTIAHREQHSDIEYRALLVDQADRENAIVNVLRFYEARNTLVFCSTRAMVTHLTTRFLNRGFQVVALSGELSQAERSHALQAMRDGRARVCIATDVAARGIDLPGLELVVHADLPVNKEALLHRSGRTGRAGSKGVSAIIVPFSARKKAERLLGLAGISAEWGSAPSAEEVSARDVDRLLSDPVLTQPVSEDETALVTRLMQTYDAEALAAAVMRQYMAQRSAPEDLVPVSPDGAKPRARVEFGESLWVALTVGVTGRADPRWLLPMLCRAGDLSRRDIGAIRVQEEQTLVQLHADCAQRFLAAIGPERMLEDGIGVTVLDKAPTGLEAESAPRPARAPRADGRGDAPKPRAPYGEKKPYRKGQTFEAEGKPAVKPWAKPEGKAGKPAAKFGKPAAGAKPTAAKPGKGGKPKPKGWA
ncbi:ATP-dependent RNA helicase [Rhodobacter veldkampii DSM 11550]|uniref:ATP-dependent RNA helicase n=1 Tax=Phaeovulum veldkampii DSM 11550 TaxID=1185920 RepID=A0A2T4JK99_9RHOB|nr:DEAD/DEAH box helicase [Phaeovulum veldkampii]MBK5946088.1 ATP-dependent RNA helicase [Phaeovulum veldkampii DSM 11550]NCU19340.1 DEAD/DEAH box helicase [Candidatus Falkowbacteria bacterium]PTE18187.1 ATP-dependent RNA helicase [Phaeovulum veldkampii DSM 11550]TDQ63512.1 ATP-dependent RNA helicase DeaD [Phaeovulum veldkampii DSM 11550]